MSFGFVVRRTAFATAKLYQRRIQSGSRHPFHWWYACDIFGYFSLNSDFIGFWTTTQIHIIMYSDSFVLLHWLLIVLWYIQWSVLWSDQDQRCFHHAMGLKRVFVNNVSWKWTSAVCRLQTWQSLIQWLTDLVKLLIHLNCYCWLVKPF